MDHSHGAGTGFSLISIASSILAVIGLGVTASVVAIASGVISIIINWPKLKTRFNEIFNRNK